MEQDLFGTCPYATAQRLIQGKWAIILMHELSGEPVRFNELQRRMPKMTHATLSNQLKQLESEGLIQRVVYSDIPPKVEYSLTDMGRKFNPVLDSIRAFGDEYIQYMNERNDGDDQS
ncbi:helix-turn-helix transcriptional regulator [Streptococcus suis]|uniref:winged helix-turn-helix transcriptional regulator n=1 Tax=Streptococcus suis TaxID=1307 RepID=UPI0019215207|nr:helix-turn-helix domain-containing protein [Streptococcus suis]MBL1126229.1 helix-turn-helix transcriptional regulator [Streptococcus suis]